MWQWIAVGLVSITVLPVATLAQSGAIGGSIGKPDKSVSGTTQPHKQVRKRTIKAVANTKPSRTISGRWIWSATCDDGSKWSGEFSFEQNPDGTLTGSCTVHTGPGGACGALSGRVSGSKVTFSVRWHGALGSHWNPYSLSLAASGQTMSGTELSKTQGTCHYKVHR